MTCRAKNYILVETEGRRVEEQSTCSFRAVRFHTVAVILIDSTLMIAYKIQAGICDFVT